ncbi:MAG: phage integrase N-terminal SAM-like domain-containing protein [Prevotellaceae bacterium]|jgi:site-specific recombinase XerD|nr:phage integrase N-terminal SAM-like domain-containing protein [Prevotellaceae bacterium]
MNKKNFINYLEGKGLAPLTQKQYFLVVSVFFKWAKTPAEQVTKPDILRYLEYIKKRRGLQNVTRQNHLIALNHYFTHLCKEGETDKNPCNFLKIRGTNKKRLHKIYTPEELETLFDNYYQLFVRSYDDSRHRHEAQRHYSRLYRERNALIISILFNQGITTTEIERIELADIDLTKASIKIKGGKRLNDRVLPLKATQIGLFIAYLQNTRPQLAEYQTKESEKLFLGLTAICNKTTEKDMNRGVFKPLAEQVKSIDKQFNNFQQIRASIIIFWVKSYGLRKAQHLAGHRFISATEKYQINNLDGLTDDINKLHPFL